MDLPAGVFGAAIVGGTLLALAAAGAFGASRPLAVFGLLAFTPVVLFAVLSQFPTVFGAALRALSWRRSRACWPARP